MQPFFAAFVEERCFAQREVWCGAGVKRGMFRCTPAQLLKLSGATRADLAERVEAEEGLGTD